MIRPYLKTYFQIPDDAPEKTSAAMRMSVKRMLKTEMTCTNPDSFRSPVLNTNENILTIM
jgi:hypothetical protein